MNRFKNHILLLPFILLILSNTTHEKPLIILALGDSITQGGKTDRLEYTYRLPLQMILHQNNINFDFVGSQKKGLHEAATWPDIAKEVPFDPNHEGYYGNTTADACSKAIVGYDQYQTPPDMVLIHLGTNDQENGAFEKNVGQPLREIISFLRTKNPNVMILLGHLNYNDSPAAFDIRKVVESLAIEMNTTHSQIKTVDHFKGWNENPASIYGDTFDWAHPNIKGQEKMAKNWWEAMQPLLISYKK